TSNGTAATRPIVKIVGNSDPPAASRRSLTVATRLIDRIRLRPCRERLHPSGSHNDRSSRDKHKFRPCLRLWRNPIVSSKCAAAEHGATPNHLPDKYLSDGIGLELTETATAVDGKAEEGKLLRNLIVNLLSLRAPGMVRGHKGSILWARKKAHISEGGRLMLAEL
ncbi:cap-specific mRNA nucleoside-2-O-methyltransferase, partial [Striga asiatica]